MQRLINLITFRALLFVKLCISKLFDGENRERSESYNDPMTYV